MKRLKCIIADDEPIARQILKKYVGDVPYLELVATCKNAMEVLDVLQEQSVDLLFLDINMPKLSGISLLKTLTQRPKVILTTAYPEYALEGFELSVTDYLLKPFSFERFLKAVGKVKEAVAPIATPVSNADPVPVRSLFVKSDKKMVKVKFDEIHYIEAYGNYIKIYTDTTLLTQQTLSEFLTKLPAEFIRIHKSYVINFHQLKLVEGNHLVLENETSLPIGKSYKKAVLDRINDPTP